VVVTADLPLQRIPAAHVGLYGLKGSNARLPHDGLNGSHGGMDAIVGSLGPLTRSARDLALFCKTMLDAEPWFLEPQILEIPWRQTLVDGKDATRRLSFAILWDDGVVAPHPPILAALQKTQDALLKAGHDVIDWKPPTRDHLAAWELITKLYFPDGGAEYQDTIRDGGELPTSQSEFIFSFAPKRTYTVQETWKLNKERDSFRTRLVAHWLATSARTRDGRPVDAVLSPVAPTLAPPHDTSRWWSYTSYWNLADYPGVVFPVGRHNAANYVSKDRWPPAAPRNETEAFVQSQWDPQTYENAPVSLQLVARRLNEEKLLHALNVVEKAIHEQHQQA
jgi:amidase